MADAYLKEDGTGRYQLEDGSGVYLLESEDAVVDDVSDGWWAGVARCGAGIALAGALALHATAVQAQSRINNAGDDFAPQAAPTPVGDTTQPDYRVGSAQVSVRYIFGGDDFVPPQPAAFVSDADEVSGQQFKPVTPRLIVRPVQYEDEIVPQPAAPSNVPGDSGQPHYTAKSQTSVVYISLGDDFVPPAPIDSGDGLVWISVAPAYKAPIVVPSYEDFPPPPVVIPPPIGELISPVYQVRPSKTVIRYVYGDEQLPVAVIATLAFEDDWAQPILHVVLPRIIQPWVFGEIERVLPGVMEGVFDGQVIGGPVMSGTVIGGAVFSGAVIGSSVMMGTVVSRDSD